MSRALLTLATLLALSGTAIAQEQVLTVWDWQASDPRLKPWYARAIAAFEKKHPGVTVRQVAQPGDKYLTVLGTAINASRGPDVVLIHGGNEGADRAVAFQPLNNDLGPLKDQIAGLDSFKDRSGRQFALPITIQGAVWYFNRNVFRKAGLDPNRPIASWDDIRRICTAVTARLHIPCLVLGNKDGLDVSLLVASLAGAGMSDAARARYFHRDLPWTSPELSAPVKLVAEAVDKGWIARGANSYSSYSDTVNLMASERAAMMLGLASDAPNSWKAMDEMVGPDAYGVAMPVAVPWSPANKTRMEIDGGTGYAVTRWSTQKGLALDFIRELVTPASAQMLLNQAGGFSSLKAINLAAVPSPTARRIIGFINCCRREPRVKTYYPAAEKAELQRASQLLLAQAISADEVIARVEAVRQADLKRKRH